jgi:hypothetical protein
MNDIRKMLGEHAALPLWQEAGKALGLRRGSTHAAAERRDIKTIRIGRLLKVPTAWLRAKLDLEVQS